MIGGKPGETVDPHIRSEVVWHLDGETVTRYEKLASTENISLRRWWIAIPTTAPQCETSFIDGRRRDGVRWADGRLSISAATDWKYDTTVFATGDSALGRGARKPIPLHLLFETRDLVLTANKPLSWRLILNMNGKLK